MRIRFFYKLGLLFFFLMLVIPTTLQTIRAGILLVLIVAVSYSAIFGNWKINKSILLIGISCVTVSIFFIILGLLYNAPGAIQVGTVYVLWPLLFIFIMGVFENPKDFQPFIKTIIVGVICSAIMGIMIVAEVGGYANFGLMASLDFLGSAVGIYDGYIQYNLSNLTTVMYGYGFLLTLVSLTFRNNFLNKYWIALVYFALILGAIAMFLSGRRAFWVAALLSPLLIYILSLMTIGGKYFKLKIYLYSSIAILLCAVLLLWVFNFNLANLWEILISGFNFNDDANISASARKDQFIALWYGWQDSPFLGHGHGSYAATSIRDSDQPWAYELSYMALLFQVGLLGMFVYASALVWLYVQSIRIVRQRSDAALLLLPLLVGLTNFLIMNATNPYLAKFDYLWVIFLPVAIVNSYLLQSSK